MYDSCYDEQWIDSVSFLPMSLAKTLTGLGFEDLERGYFPHNTKANEFYIAPYPNPSFYGYNTMTVEGNTKFMMWYQTVHTDHFYFQREICKYCINDVEVLRKACLIYHETLMNCAGLNRFTFMTIASYCI